MTRACNAVGIEMPNESSTTTCCHCRRLHSSALENDANSSIFFFVLCCCRLIKVLAEFRLKSLSGFHSSECWGNLRSFFLKWICDLFRSMERIQSWGCRYFAGLINPMEIERSSPLFANNSWSIQSHPRMWACEVCTNSQPSEAAQNRKLHLPHGNNSPFDYSKKQ